ncbi:MAG: single-stranded DNA-binding protein [Clostridiales Family XIII bacterium]|jgi:single-strand DNA-binding protein|nr:single-stranded DNA-binding protein [Clostridiales Family XIII bacterium]
MNVVILTGNLARDPEVRYGANQLAIARLTIAVRDSFSREERADFIRVVAFGKTAEFVERYMKKGSRVEVEGRWKHDSYEKDGQRIYTDECIANRVEFGGPKSSNAQGGGSSWGNAEFPEASEPSGAGSFGGANAGGASVKPSSTPIPSDFSLLDDDDDDLPF